ncbi:MAG: formimidoylglutamase [Ginsengibacter sp.]
MHDLNEFFEKINVASLNNDEGYGDDAQFANHISTYENELPDLTGIDIVIAGVNDQRGGGVNMPGMASAAIRKQLYQLHYWHTDTKIADIGDIKTGATITDTYAAAKIVLAELLRLSKTVILIGGSHDVTLAQYYAYKELNQIVEASVVDAAIDLKGDKFLKSENFLMEMLTSEPNHVQHYNHIGFQSYLVHPRMLETMDKLRFDCYRVGMAKENIEEMEPVIRNTNLLSFDISAIKNSDAPAGNCSPNGFTGEEACMLSRYAGMSTVLSTFGVYGYNPESDVKELTAKQIAQMIWYFIDGKSRSKQETKFEDRHNFNEYHTVFAEVETVFLQSKKTGRWWMELPDKKMIACSYKDYSDAGRNKIPERWLRAQERK